MECAQHLVAKKKKQNLAIVCEKLLPRFLRPVIEKVSAGWGR
jgi:hypothetical protein